MRKSSLPLWLAALLPVALVLTGCGGSGANEPAGQPAAATDAAKSDSTGTDSTLVTLTAGEAAHDWPRWRGPTADGISRETNWRDNWNDQPPKVLWEAELGKGYSSFAVSDGRVYTMGHRDGRETVWCFDAATGKVLWSHSYPGQLNDNLHTGGPAATPTVDGERVYTLGKEGKLHCLDRRDVKVLWQHDLTELLGVDVPEWGFACSPLVVGEKLVIDAGRIVAFNKDNGQIIWQTERHRAGYGSAVALAHAGTPLVAVFNNDALLVLRLADGSQVARQNWTTDFVTTAATPIVDGDRIFISSGYRTGCAMYQLADGKLRQLYRNRDMCNHMNNCVLWQGHLYGFDGNSHNARNVRLVCLDAATGKEKWAHRGLGCGSLMLADSKLLILSDDGNLVLAAASPDGYQELARAKVLDATCWTVPVLAQGRIYCRNDQGQMVCIDVSK